MIKLPNWIKWSKDKGKYILEVDKQESQIEKFERLVGNRDITKTRFCESCGINSDNPQHDTVGIKCEYIECECDCHG